MHSREHAHCVFVRVCVYCQLNPFANRLLPMNYNLICWANTSYFHTTTFTVGRTQFVNKSGEE